MLCSKTDSFWIMNRNFILNIFSFNRLIIYVLQRTFSKLNCNKAKNKRDVKMCLETNKKNVIMCTCIKHETRARVFPTIHLKANFERWALFSLVMMSVKFNMQISTPLCAANVNLMFSTSSLSNSYQTSATDGNTKMFISQH